MKQVEVSDTLITAHLTDGRVMNGAPAARERAALTGGDPILPTDFKIGTAATATIAATALAASEVWRLRTGHEQSVTGMDTPFVRSCGRPRSSTIPCS